MKNIDAKAFFGYRFHDADGHRPSASAENLAGISFRGDGDINKDLRIENRYS